jgi:glucose uptake protein GlcU
MAQLGVANLLNFSQISSLASQLSYLCFLKEKNEKEFC